MANILYEPGSVRGDAGILYITQKQPCIIPFYFKIPITRPNGDTGEYVIRDTDVVSFTIKPTIHVITPTICKRYTQIVNNVAILRLDMSDMKLFGGYDYVLSAELFDSAGNKLYTMVKRLPIKIQAVV